MTGDPLYYRVKTICSNCGAGQEYQEPKGVTLDMIECINCGCKTLRLASQDEAKNVPALTFTKHKIICENCHKIHIFETPSYENINFLMYFSDSYPCEFCKINSKKHEVKD